MASSPFCALVMGVQSFCCWFFLYTIRTKGKQIKKQEEKRIVKTLETPLITSPIVFIVRSVFIFGVSARYPGSAVSGGVPAERARAHHRQPAIAFCTRIKGRTHPDAPTRRGSATFPPRGPDLLAFTSLSALFVCEVVLVIKFLRVGKKKEVFSKGGSLANEP